MLRSLALLIASQSGLELPGFMPLLTFFDFTWWKYDFMSLFKDFISCQVSTFYFLSHKAFDSHRLIFYNPTSTACELLFSCP